LTTHLDPLFQNGNLVGFFTNSSVPREDLKAVLSKDLVGDIPDDNDLLSSPRCYLGFWCFTWEGRRTGSSLWDTRSTSFRRREVESLFLRAIRWINRKSAIIIIFTEADRYRLRTALRLIPLLGKKWLLGRWRPRGCKLSLQLRRTRRLI
jgi:hypothetical protein